MADTNVMLGKGYELSMADTLEIMSVFSFS